MTARTAWFGVIVFTLGLAGCLPEEKIVWSPSGQTAALLGGNGLFFCDEDGNVVAKTDIQPTCVTWFADGKRLAIGSSRVAKWDEIAALMEPARRARTIALADALYKQIMDYSGDWDQFKPATDPDGRGGSEILYQLEYIRNQHPKELAAKLGGKMKQIAEISAPVYDLSVYEWNGDLGKAAKPLVTSLDSVRNVQVNPGGTALAYTTDVQYASAQAAGQIPAHALFVMSVAGGGEPAKLADMSGYRPAWMNDTRLAYAASPSGGAGFLSVATVCDKNGQLLPDVKAGKASVTTELAIAYDSNFSVQAVDSNRLVFTSTPMPDKSGETKPLLYIYDQMSGKLVHEANFEDITTDSMFGFSLSPDRTKVVMGVDDLIIVDIKYPTSPTVEIVNKADGGRSDVGVLPAWRTNEEVTFVVPAGSSWGSPDREELVVWSLKEGAVNPVRVLSKEWPNELARGILQEKQPTTQPASGPATQPATKPASQP